MHHNGKCSARRAKHRNQQTANVQRRYPECAHLTVTGSGSGVPSGSYLAAIPGVYSMSDPEININIYSQANQGVTTYTIPGPAVWTG
jgi:hypothetical protein